MAPESLQEERKLVTVVFADLVGSTALAAQQDPEQLRGLLSAFFEEMAQQIRSFGGTVEKYAGDAIMAVFGVPRVHEDDAERAVRAAIAMQETIGQLNPTFEQEYHSRLALRVGIATGEVVAATQETREFMVTGEVANLAARLQSAACGIVVSEETHRLLGPLLESRRLDPLSLKGFSEPVTAYRVIGLRQLDRKPRGIPGLHSPMVGRDREAEILNRCVEDLQRARGQIISIIGEAGLGKSRLKIELREGLPEGVSWLEGRCYAHTQTTSYAPFIQILKADFQLGAAEPQVVARTKLRAALRSLVEERYDQVHPAVAHLLNIELEPGQLDGRSLDPRALQSQLVSAMRALIEALSARKPLVLAFEDIHWADAASIELLTVLMELTDFIPLIILTVCRPDVEGGSWDFRFHAQRNYPHRLTEIQLAPLASEQAQRLIRNLLHISDLPDQIQGLVLDRSEGNPLFLEEIVRTLIEEQVLRREGERWTAAGEVERPVIPGLLRGVIAARIDHLPPAAKVVLQHAAVVGRVFTYRALQALTDGDGDLDRALAHLLRADFIREQARLPEVEYLFKHVLTQEAAYASILNEQRRSLHRKVAVFMEPAAADTPAEHAAVLAHHWLCAEDWAKALKYTLQAAERASKLYARPEAIAHYWQALELLERVPQTLEQRHTHMDVVLALVKQPGSFRDADEQKRGSRHIDKAIRFAADSGEMGTLAQLEALKAYDLWDESLFIQAVAHSEVSGDKFAQAFTAELYGHYLGANGQFVKALTHIDQAMDIMAAAGATYAHAWYMASGGRCYCARAGKLEKALGYAAGAREIEAAMGDARLRAWCGMEAEPLLYKGLWEQVVRVAEKGLTVSWEIGEWGVIFALSAWLGIAYLKLGRLEDARTVIDRALKESQAGNFPPYAITYLQISAAQLRLALGEPDQALKSIRKALQLSEISHIRLEQGAANRVLGQVHETMGSREEADAAFRLSLQILGEIESRPELAQTLLAYGRFKAGDDPDKGSRLIERALRTFEEIGATGWITEARAARS